MASKSALEQIKVQRRFNAQQSSRLRSLERSFAEMVTRAQNPRWWEQRQAELDVNVARFGSNLKKENQINWNGSEAPSPPKTKRTAVWGGFKNIRRNVSGRLSARRWRKLSPRSAQTRPSSRVTRKSDRCRVSPRSAAAGRQRSGSSGPSKSSSRITVERKDRKIQNLINSGPVLISPRSEHTNGDDRKSMSPPTQKQNATRAPLPPRQNAEPMAQNSTAAGFAGIRQRRNDSDSDRKKYKASNNIRQQGDGENNYDHNCKSSNTNDVYEDKYADDEFEDAFEEDDYSSGDDDFEGEIQAAMSRKENNGDAASRVERPQRNQPTRLGILGHSEADRQKDDVSYSYSDDDFVQDDDGSGFGYSDDEFERIA